jgi:hypothetical protein
LCIKLVIETNLYYDAPAENICYKLVQ